MIPIKLSLKEQCAIVKLYSTTHDSGCVCMLIIAGVEKESMLICCHCSGNGYANEFEENELVEYYLFYGSK